MPISQQIKFSFYGLGVEVNCQDPETLQRIQRDYSFFLNNEVRANVSFNIHTGSPDYSQLPPLKAYLYTPRNICYKQNNISFIDYFGKGLTIIDHTTNVYTVSCADPDLRQEIVFLSILSLVGQHCDAQHLHRVHSLGLAVNNKAILILLPSGGGKTTLLLELIKQDMISLISEDSPLIDAAGNALPFPIRIGISQENKPANIPEEHLHLIQRMEFGPKYTIDINFFKDKLIRQPVPVRHILCGVRSLGNAGNIQPLSKYSAFQELIKNSVVGLGLYQGIEFLFQHGIWELLKKSGTIASRIKNTVKILSTAKTYTFTLGTDRKKNTEIFIKFCRENT